MKYTADCDLAFIVDQNKTNDFLNVKPNSKIRSQQEKQADEISINIENK